jgi:hypothetical protein
MSKVRRPDSQLHLFQAESDFNVRIQGLLILQWIREISKQ